MSEFKLPHVEDLTTNSKLPGQLTENFKAIEQAANDLQGEIDSEEQDRKSEENKLNGRIDNLDKQKATHDEVKEIRQELQQRINHLYAGDPRTIKTVVKEILEEKGVI